MYRLDVISKHKWASLTVVTALVAGSAVATGMATLGQHTKQTLKADSPGATISNLGSSIVTVTAAMQPGIQHVEQSLGLTVGTIVNLGARDNVSFYQLKNTGGPDCFAIARRTTTLGQVRCSTDFPSPTRPVLDFTGFKQLQPGDPKSARIVDSAGFATDGVADIAFSTANGDLVDETPVANNFYDVTAPPDEYVTGIVAQDADGNTIWTEAYPDAAIRGG
jgi:hypothetical protein